MQRLEDKAFRTLSSSASASSASSASAASKRLLERGLSKLKAGRAKNRLDQNDVIYGCPLTTQHAVAASADAKINKIVVTLLGKASNNIGKWETPAACACFL